MLKPGIYASTDVEVLTKWRVTQSRAAPPRECHSTIGPSASGLRLPRSDLGQRQLNPIHFLTNHPNRLVIARIRHRFDRFCRVTNLVAAIPNEVDSHGGLHSVEINPSGQSRSEEHTSELQ